MAPVKGKGTPAVGIGAEASDELVKMRATVSQMQEEMSELVRVRNKLETENLKLRTENTALQTQNARLLAQAEARARLMQSIQSTLGTGM
jgi:regulator of replication initiation timing